MYARDFDEIFPFGVGEADGLQAIEIPAHQLSKLQTKLEEGINIESVIFATDIFQIPEEYGGGSKLLKYLTLLTYNFCTGEQIPLTFHLGPGEGVFKLMTFYEHDHHILNTAMPGFIRRQEQLLTDVLVSHGYVHGGLSDAVWFVSELCNEARQLFEPHDVNIAADSQLVEQVMSKYTYREYMNVRGNVSLSTAVASSELRHLLEIITSGKQVSWFNHQSVIRSIHGYERSRRALAQIVESGIQVSKESFDWAYKPYAQIVFETVDNIVREKKVHGTPLDRLKALKRRFLSSDEPDSEDYKLLMSLISAEV